MLVAAGKRLGVMGGMFDPVHEGHLQLARQVKQLCELDEILLVPCGTPVHRPHANAPAPARIAMLELAAREQEGLQVDARECLSKTPSYTYNTLSAIHAEQPGAILHLLLGLDAFLALPTWYRWQEIFQLAHVVVVARPGYELEETKLARALAVELSNRRVQTIAECKQAAAGKVLVLNIPTPPISSTDIRNMTNAQRAVSHYLNKDVATYIRTHKLYKQQGERFETN